MVIIISKFGIRGLEACLLVFTILHGVCPSMICPTSVAAWAQPRTRTETTTGSSGWRTPSTMQLVPSSGGLLIYTVGLPSAHTLIIIFVLNRYLRQSIVIMTNVTCWGTTSYKVCDFNWLRKLHARGMCGSACMSACMCVHAVVYVLVYVVMVVSHMHGCMSSAIA